MQFHAIYTQPRKEFQARNEIKDLGFETYLPVQTRSVVIRRKRVSLTESLYPRYIFCAWNHGEPYGEINRCRGVEYILENNSAPMIVPNAVIEILKMAEKAGAFDFARDKAKFKAGDSVEILEGPFAGIIAKVQSASPRKRVKILMKLLSSEIATDIAPELIRKVDAGACNSIGTR